MNPLDWKAALHVQHEGFAPLYVQLAERLRAVIGRLDPGEPIPSEKELMELTGVGRVTARKAVSELVGDGLLVSIRGKGTFVAQPRVATKLGRLAGFSETMNRLGRRPDSQIVSAVEGPASALIAQRLSIQAGTPIYRIERLRLMDGEICMSETSHIPASLAPGLLDEDLRGSLYDLLRSKWGVRPAMGSETIIAMSADHEIAHALGIPVGDAVLATSRITVTDTGQPVEFTVRRARGDLCSFLVPLTSESVLSDQSMVDVSLLG